MIFVETVFPLESHPGTLGGKPSLGLELHTGHKKIPQRSSMARAVFDTQPEVKVLG